MPGTLLRAGLPTDTGVEGKMKDRNKWGQDPMLSRTLGTVGRLRGAWGKAL